ncbi:MAG: hypothetical protein P8N08_04810 [Flavobacteriaceae bacterium]|nr:hypothetical protein [Flavobacteriaceae bacterium]
MEKYKYGVEINAIKILISLFEKYKNETWVLTGEEVSKKIYSFFSGKWGQVAGFRPTPKFGLPSGVFFEGNKLYFIMKKEYINVFLDVGNSGLNSGNLSIKRLTNRIKIEDLKSISLGSSDGDDYYGRKKMKLSSPEIKFLKEFIDNCSVEAESVLLSINKEKERKIKKENQRVKSLKKSQNSFLKEFDKDGNGIIDAIDGHDDFMKLFRKHQKVIKEFNIDYINYLVKISNYLKNKRNNIQSIFLEIRKTKNKSQLEENIGLLKNQIHTYEVILFHSLHLINSIVIDDLITVNEIYEEFDKLKIFKSDHEKEVTQKLSDISDGLSILMYSINSMERNIVSGLNKLSYITQDGFSNLNKSLNKELKSIHSSIEGNNLLSLISTYQLYKINKNTKSLRG